MANITFKRRCNFCEFTDGMIHSIIWSHGVESLLYTDGLSDLQVKIFIGKGKLDKNYYKTRKYITKSEMSYKLEQWHTDTKHICESCGRGSDFYFEDIKIDGELLKDDIDVKHNEPLIKSEQAHEHFSRALQYSKQGNYNLAIREYTSILESYPKSYKYRDVYFRRAQLYEKQGKFELVISDYTNYINLVEDSTTMPELFFYRGLAYSMNKNYELAIADFTTVIIHSPYQFGSDAFNNRGNNYQKQGKYELAIADFTSAIKKNSNKEAFYFNRANAYVQQGKYELAIVDYNEAIKINPMYDEVLNNRGDTYFRQNKYELAITDFTAAIKINPNLSEAFFTRGEVYYKLGNEEFSISDFKMAASLGDIDAVTNLKNFFNIDYHKY